MHNANALQCAGTCGVFCDKGRFVWSFHRLSVRAQLLLLVVAVSVPLLGLLAFHLEKGRQTARHVAYEQVRMLARNAASSLDALLGDHQTVLERIARRPQVMALDGNVCDPIITEFVRLYPEFTNLVVQDRAGQNDCSFLAQKITPAQLQVVPGFQDAWSRGTMTVGGATLGPLSGRWISVLFYPVRDGQGRTTGMINLPMDLEHLRQRVMAAVPPGALVLVLDKAGRIVLRSQDGAAWMGRLVPEPMHQLATGPQEEGEPVFSIDGVARLFAVASVERAGWSVLAGVPAAQVFADSDVAFAQGGLWTLAILALAFGLAWRIGRGIVQPIESLSLAAAHVADGLASTRVQVQRAPRELETVAKQFNHMLDARERALTRLQASEERFRTLAELSSDWYWEQDAQYRFVRFDGRVLKGTGIPSEEYVGKTRWDLPAQNLGPDDWAQHRALLDGHQPFRNFEILRRGRDGQEYWGLVSGTPIVDDLGDFVAIAVWVRISPSASVWSRSACGCPCTSRSCLAAWCRHRRKCSAGLPVNCTIAPAPIWRHCASIWTSSPGHRRRSAPRPILRAVSRTRRH